ncbi:MAG: hypothetical protein ACI8WI_003345, partial [Pseudoalteromonas distincta]
MILLLAQKNGSKAVFLAVQEELTVSFFSVHA